MEKSIGFEQNIALEENKNSLVPSYESNLSGAKMESIPSAIKTDGSLKRENGPYCNPLLNQDQTSKEIFKSNQEWDQSLKLEAKITCQNEKCHFSKLESKMKDSKNKENEIVRKRKRCGTCTGCALAENCGTCGPCFMKLDGKDCHRICSARKCLVLKTEKSKRCGEHEAYDSEACDDLNEKLFYGLGIKIKRKSSKSDKKIGQEEMEVDDELGDITFEDEVFMPIENLLTAENVSHKPSSKQQESEDLGKNNKIQKTHEKEGDPTKEKGDDCGAKNSPNLGISKSVKRIRKCGVCSGCQIEDCGHCQSCRINQAYGEEKLILGKVSCLTNSCKSPIQLEGGLALTQLKLQDDTSNGTLCPVKIIHGILYDFRCFFCKKLPRPGSANKSELMRHYSTVHYADVLKKDFQIFMNNGHCLLCNTQLKNHCIPSHIGQKHNEVVNYLPPEALALCPEEVKKEKTGARGSKLTNVTKVLNFSQNHQGFNANSGGHKWKENSSSHGDKNKLGENSSFHQGGKNSSSREDKKKLDQNFSSREDEKKPDKNYEIVDGWILEHNQEPDEEQLVSSIPDYSGVGGICGVCQMEFQELTDTALHLHTDHHIQGGSSHVMKDCQNFIQSGLIQVSRIQSESISVGIHDSSNEDATTKANDGVISLNSEVASGTKSTSQKMKKSVSSRNLKQRKNATSPWILHQTDKEEGCSSDEKQAKVSSDVNGELSNVEEGDAEDKS